MNKLADQILDCFAMSLDLTEKEAATIHRLHTGHDSQLRLLHYPPVSPEMLAKQDIGRLAAHTDFRHIPIILNFKK
jgi:isopenicillin N synthase-like dioxygenase